MARVRKTYQAIHFIQLDTYANVNGKKIAIQFTGGSLKPRINGKFTTDDQELIRVLDADAARPGASFRCINTEVLDNSIPKSNAASADTGADTGTGTEGTGTGTEGTGAGTEGTGAGTEGTGAGAEGTGAGADITSVPGITTVQAAKEYLNKTFGIAISKMPNAAAVKNQAEANKVKFVDLA